MQFLRMKDRSAKARGKSFKKAVTMGVNNEINFLLNGKLRLHSCNCIQKRINIQNENTFLTVFLQQWIGLSNILQITYMHVHIYTLLELHLHAYSALITIEIQI